MEISYLGAFNSFKLRGMTPENIRALREFNTRTRGQMETIEKLNTATEVLPDYYALNNPKRRLVISNTCDMHVDIPYDDEFIKNLIQEINRLKEKAEKYIAAEELFVPSLEEAQ